jgi:transcriptional regulator with XRE-family HTH domain
MEISMTHPIPAEVLKHVREAQGLSQAALAKQMGTVASVLSKLEKADDAEPEVAERYLTAVASDLAVEVADYYARSWRQATPPSFLHPDRETLWTIDKALRDLDVFESERSDPILRGPIDLLRSELRTTDTYLRRRDHVVAWIGDIGVGKTTALTHAVGLLVGDGRSGRRPAFPVGQGRVTVCETAIRVAPTFGVLVDALEDEEVVRLTRDLVSSVAPGAAGVGVSAEIARLLRNMSKMKSLTTMVGDDPISTDPIADLLATGLGVDEVTDRMVVAMELGDRKERQIILPEGSEDGLPWVSRLVSNINSGADPRFGVPRRITVLMPSKNLSADGQILSVVDTRGVENVTQRPDLTAHSDDTRTLVVLCTKFADAPNTTVQRHLQESQEAGSDAAERHRQCILVLPRGDEAFDVPGFDEPIASRQQGYAARRKEVEQALIAAHLPRTPVYFFDARNDDADKIWATLRGQVAQMRGAYADRAKLTAGGVDHLINNVQSVRALEARSDVEREMARVLQDVTTLADTVRPAHQNLIDQISVGHHSSIAASIYRRGDWENFQFAHILGNGVRTDANLRSGNQALRIEHQLQNLESKYDDLEGVVQNLQALRARLGEGRQEFLAAARTIGRDAYGSLLAEQAHIWNESGRRYGQGSGYKRDVAAIWREWFESSDEVRATMRSVNERLQDAWTTWVLEPLRRATRAGSDG